VGQHPKLEGWKNTMSMSIQNAIDTIIAGVTAAPFADTVDVVKMGDPARELTGIAVAFLATSEVIQKAAQLGANLIITHEPVFYSHLDATDWLTDSFTFQAKKQLIQQSGAVIWRFHDYLHSLSPDPTLMGLVKELGWQAYISPEGAFVCNLPPTTLQKLIEHVHQRLDLGVLRVVGDPAMQCKTVGLLPGFPPAEMQMGIFERPGVDVLIAGEIHEWETSEFVRDANRLGTPKGLVVIGHKASEEPGMRWIIPWLQERLPGAAIHFIPTGSAFLKS
jgi:putative NIF3 family GTP cyclohydrolase 1 type 2